jgi:OmpA-OmpF porin, OOP family
MKKLSVMLGVLTAAAFGAAFAAEPWTTPAYSVPVCQVGLHGTHPAGLDQDVDGIPDSEDWCSGTPAGAHVGPDGCQAGEIDVACDKTPPPRKMEVVPAAPVVRKVSRDSDNDGIDDEDDKCSGTPSGAEVDGSGCVKIEKVVLKGVNFATGSSKLLPAASDTLRSVAGAMKNNSKLEVEVGGYTDSVGDEAKNQGLSERRAKSVKSFLVKEGVDEGRLSTKGYGESNPVDTNDTKEGRANNRRVAFKVTKS